MGFEVTVSADERPQTYALDRAATGLGRVNPSSRENLQYLCDGFVNAGFKYCERHNTEELNPQLC